MAALLFRYTCKLSLYAVAALIFECRNTRAFLLSEISEQYLKGLYVTLGI